MNPPLLQVDSIEKSFSAVRVLKNVTFSLEAGQTLGLIGENGAGKSTLMNILGGNLQPDAGQMRLANEPFAPRGPQDASGRGIAFVHQELNLFPNLTVAENLFLLSFPTRGARGLRWIDRQTLRQRSMELLSQVGLTLSPDSVVERLSAGERQLVEIAKALSTQSRIIILDEPTTSLTTRETERLFRLMGSLRARGVAMIYISHNLGDVLKLCDRLLVLRDGEVVGSGARAEFALDQIVSLMVGRSISQMFPRRTSSPLREVALEVRSVCQPGVVKDISFSLHQGEVLGIAGLMGSGRSELARILFGLDSFERGEILIHGHPCSRIGPRRSIERGVAFVTEDRHADGLCLEASIAENIALVSLPALAGPPFGLIDRLRQNHAIAEVRRAIRLTHSARDEQAVRTLSGGNQQKVVLAKWLLAKPRVFILDEPTRGIDVGAKVEVYTLINELASAGAGVLVISSDLEELIGISDRIVVMSQGEIRDEMARVEFDRERILRSALHGHPVPGPGPGAGEA